MKQLQRIMYSFLIVMLVISSFPGLDLSGIRVSATSVTMGDSVPIPAGTTSITGGSKGYGIKPNAIGYRFMVTDEVMKSSAELKKEGHTEEELKNKMRQQFNDHFPKHGASITIVPSEIYTESMYASRYDAASGSLFTARKDGSRLITRMIKEGAGNHEKKLMQALVVQIKSKGLKSLTSAKLTELRGSNSSGAAAESYFRWLAGNGAGIGTRMDAALHPAGYSATEKDIAHQAAYIAHLSYMRQAANPDMATVIDGVINRYVTQSDDWVKRPGILAVDSVVVIVTPGSNPNLAIPTTDYINYHFGMKGGSRIDNPGWSGKSYTKTFDMMKDALAITHRNAPNRTATSNMSGDAYTNTPFGWGFSALLDGYYFRSNKGQPNSISVGQAANASASGYSLLEGLQFDGGLVGFIVAVNDQLVPKGDPPLMRQDNENDQPERRVITVPQGQTAVPIKLDAIIELETKAKNANQIESSVKFFKSLEGSYPLMVTNIDIKTPFGDFKNTEASSGKFKHENGNKQYYGAKVPVTTDYIQTMLKGTQVLKYKHSINEVYTYTSNSSVILKFEYFSKVNYRLDSNNLNADAEDDDGYSFFEIEIRREESPDLPPPPVELQIELKDPYAFAEVKEGDKPKEEKWEAMQGVPTTETLHFSIGGSEFLLKTRLKYNPSQSHTRTIKLGGSKAFHGNFSGDSWDLPEGQSPSDSRWTQAPYCSSYSDTVGSYVMRPGGGDVCESTSSNTYCSEGHWEEQPDDEDGNPVPDDWVCDVYRESYSVSGVNETASSPTNVFTDTFQYSYVEMLSAEVYQLNGGHIKGLTPLTTASDNVTVNLSDSQFPDKSLGSIAFHKAAGNTGAQGRFYYNDYGPHTQSIQIPGSWDRRSIQAQCSGANTKDNLYCDYSNSRDASLYPGGDPHYNDIQTWIKARDNHQYYDVGMVSDYLIIQTEAGTVPIYFSEVLRTAKGTDKQYNIVKSMGQLTSAEASGGSMGADPGMHNVYSTVGSGTGSLTKDGIPIAGYNGLYSQSAGSYGKYSPRILGSYRTKNMNIMTNTILKHGELQSTSSSHLNGYQVSGPVGIKNSGNGNHKIIHSGALPIELTYPNGIFTFGETKNHYIRTLNFNGDNIFSNNNGGSPRFNSTYSENHNTVNQVVIHDPVSVEYSEVISSPDKYFNVTDSSMSSLQISQAKAKNQSQFTGDGSAGFQNTNKIALDRPFTVNFPNIGDYHNNGTFGVANVLESKGPSYSNSFPSGGVLTTTEWTAAKYISFSVPVIFKGTMYSPGEEISVGVTEGCTSATADNCILQFYLPLGAGEHQTAVATFQAEAINMAYRDAQSIINRNRGNSMLQADHHAVKDSVFSIIGRAGNLVLEDSSDFRYSNTFKKPLTDRWLVKNLVRPVDESKQNTYFVSNVNYNLESLTSAPNYIDTYQSLRDGLHTAYPRANPSAYAGSRKALPLTPDKNSIPQYQKTPIRLGNKLNGSFQSIGDYHSGLAEMKMYYYAYDLTTNAVTPVDLYAYDDNSKSYEMFYDHDGWERAGFDPLKLYDSTVFINWEMEKARRNYRSMEKGITDNVSKYLSSVYDEDENGIIESNNLFGNNEYNIDFDIPRGWNYPYGNAQILQMMGRNKTFHGTNINENLVDDSGNQLEGLTADKNPGSLLQNEDYQKSAQRWHFSLHLPSSTVPVRSGQKLTKNNVDSIRGGNTVILVTADIKVLGEDYALKLHHGPNQFSLDFGNGTKVITPQMLSNSTPGSYDNQNLTMLAIYSSNKSIKDDLSQSGTH